MQLLLGMPNASKSADELTRIEFGGSSRHFNNNIFEKKPELAKLMLEYPEIMELVDNLTRSKNDG